MAHAPDSERLRSLFARSLNLGSPRDSSAEPDTVHRAPSTMRRTPLKKIREQSLVVDGASLIREDAQLLESPERVSAGAPRAVFTGGMVAMACRGHRMRSSTRWGDCAATFA